MVVRRISRLLRRPDFRNNPLKAVCRRVRWHIRWLFKKQPWPLRLNDSLEILAPKGGVGALIYYLGSSEPETTQFLTRFLRSGMVVWDIGAHIGEYSLLAAQRVGRNGRVDAFEPHPDMAGLLARSVSKNRLENVHLHVLAASDQNGTAHLSIHSEPAISSLGPETRSTTRISTTTLDAFHESAGCPPNLVKVDVEGAERLVLRGAARLLSLESAVAPVWIMEYAPENCARFGYSAAELPSSFATTGHYTYWLNENGDLVPTSEPPPWQSSGNFVASKRELNI